MYRYFTAFINSIKIFFQSFFLWPLKTWVFFWTVKRETIEIPLGPLSSFSLRGHSLAQKIVDLYMAKTCIIDRQYNPPGFEVHPKDTIIDIGGHIGSFAVLAASLANQGHVFTFEPDEANYKQLKKNTQNFKNIQSFQLAVSNTEGVIHFNRSTLNNAENSMFKKGNMEFQVPSTTLEHVFEKHNIQNCDFLKIDCEGAEYPILYAAPDHILARIKKMAIEVHQPAYFDLPEKNYNPEHLENFLRSKDFEVRRWRENAMHDLFWVRRK